MDPLVQTLLVLLAVAVGLVAGFLFRRTPSPKPDDAAFALIQNQLNAGLQQSTQQIETLRRTLQDTLQSLTQQVSGTLSETHRTLGDRLDNTTKVIGDVRQQLGQLRESSQRMIEVGQDISKLQDILQPPKLRGSLGELFLADLLAQILPPAHYRLQHVFKGGETVDAVILLHSGLVPIDAKFPLENFKRVLASPGDDARAAAKKAFIKDVKAHIDAIASKYIRTDENTFDFALMYVPAENVYYETVIKDSEFGEDMTIFNWALRKRVIPVSPNSFYAYLQTILLGLKGMRVEEQSREILDNIARLHKEFENFAEAFRLVGQHLENSSKKYSDAQRRFDKMEAKVEQLDGLARGLGTGSEPAPELLPGHGTTPVGNEPS